MRHLITCLFLITSCSLWAQEKRVVVIGFDGADHKIVSQLLDSGELPNLAKLRDKGGYQALLPTNPPQTPVSWSTFSTGINPGRTGIFDFIKRKEGSYLADFALRGEGVKTILFGERNRIILPLITFAVLFLLLFLLLRKRSIARWLVPLALSGTGAYAVLHMSVHWIPEQIPDIYTVRQGKPIWKILEEQGKSATVLRLPVTFPAEPLRGEMVAGLAVPDIRGTIGKPSIYTNDPAWIAADNQFSVAIYRLNGEGPHATTVLGPPNKLFYDAGDARQAKLDGKPYNIPQDFELPMNLTVNSGQLEIAVANQTLKLAPKSWSPWITFNYTASPLIKLQGVGRFFLDRLDGEVFKLYLTPIHFHPKSPLPLTYPASLAEKIWDDEPYKTMGWALDTWSIGNDLMDEEHFLEDIDLTVTRYEKMMESFLTDHDRELFIQVFSFTDRIGHIFWRYWDEGHPGYDPEKGPIYQEALREAYRRMDRIVGKAMAMIDFNTTDLIVCSDHGFASWRYQFNFNTWLVKNGYMTLRKNVLGQPMKLDDLQTGSSPFNYVDWSQTKAYALGLGMIFINREGREPEGVVTAAEYDAVCREISAGLEAYVDEETGLNPIRKVFHRDEMYHGYDPEITPDLRAATAPLYRVSWDTTLGGMPAEITEINPRNWSGDHCSLAPEDVPGILFSSRPIKKNNPKMADMCPSILHLLGVTTDIEMDGEVIF